MSSKEPDTTPVSREHVAAFLKWYRERCSVPTYSGVDEHWYNALHTLTLGQLRAGMRWYGQLTSAPYIGPPHFHGVCTRPRDSARDAMFKQIRETFKNGPRKGDEPC